MRYNIIYENHNLPSTSLAYADIVRGMMKAAETGRDFSSRHCTGSKKALFEGVMLP